MQRLENWKLSVQERSLAALDWLAARRGRLPERPQHLLTGERGEDAAFFFLRRNGYTVVARRWNDTPLPGDLDLIGWQGDVLCFIEVKTRTTLGMATAEAAVDQQKRKILRRLARHYLRQLPGELPPLTRFDIVTVYELPGKPRQTRIMAGAFGWGEKIRRQEWN